MFTELNLKSMKIPNIYLKQFNRFYLLIFKNLIKFVSQLMQQEFASFILKVISCSKTRLTSKLNIRCYFLIKIIKCNYESSV